MSPKPSSQPLPLPDAIEALGPDACEHVQRLVAAAEERQEAEVDGALDAGLRAVPRPLRGVAKRILIP